MLCLPSGLPPALGPFNVKDTRLGDPLTKQQQPPPSNQLSMALQFDLGQPGSYLHFKTGGESPVNVPNGTLFSALLLTRSLDPQTLSQWEFA